MDVGVVGVDHQLAIGPLRIFASADKKFEGELFKYGVVNHLEVVIGK